MKSSSSSSTPLLDWSAFLQRNDMVWDSLPADWNHAPFLGNGCLGTIAWQSPTGALHIEVSRQDLYDHRSIDPKSGYPLLFAHCRLPNGHFELDFGDPKPSGQMRLDLWNAEWRGNFKQNTKTWQLRSFVHAAMNVVVLDVIHPADAPAPTLSWHPDAAMSTRQGKVPPDLLSYPPQIHKTIGSIKVSTQEMPEDRKFRTDGLGEGQYATAWTSLSVAPNHTIYLISMGFSYPGRTAEREAISLIEQSTPIGLSQLQSSHRAWWHAFYPKSFLSIPDADMESFYWIQIYKMGSISRQGGPVVDLLGPWFLAGSWPAIWWNLNMQLTYWPYYMSNHLEEAAPLAESLWKGRQALAQNAAPYQSDSYAIGRATGPDCRWDVGKEVGNLPWVMHNLWIYYRSTMDDAFLRDRLFPLMKGSFRYLRHITVTQPDGTLSIPATASPEFTDSVDNCSYTLACYRWLASALLEADERLHAQDPIAAECREVLNKLTPYEVDPSTGFMIGKGMPFNQSHRHWSHLFMIYPFAEMDWNNTEQRPLMERSLKNWTSQDSAFAGYSWLGAASMHASAGDGERALHFLKTFLKKSPLPNTLYREGSPVIETPLACARTIQELMMTSHGGIIRIFPGLPASWKETNFADFRAEGAFLVSAERAQGVTQWVKITSLAGEPCRVLTDLPKPLAAKGDSQIAIQQTQRGVIEIDLKKGETVLLYSGQKPSHTNAHPVPQTTPLKPWGNNVRSTP